MPGMCGRFWIPDQAVEGAIEFLPPELRELARRIIEEWVADMNKPRYNLSPTQQYPVITANDVRPMRWGFITDKSNAVFNAKVESMRFPIWRESLVLRRGLVLAGGFYEWTGPKGNRQPHAIHRADGNAMTLGAIWTDDPEEGDCFSIVTVPASEWMSNLHNREPLMLDPEQAATWIDLTQPKDKIKSLMKTYTGKLAEFECPDPKQDRPPRPGKKHELF
jgi:putative SOS response-associated peptidase YedK